MDYFLTGVSKIDPHARGTRTRFISSAQMQIIPLTTGYNARRQCRYTVSNFALFVPFCG
jgi:hypothetical protein